MLRSVPPDRAPAVAGCAENQKLPKINARVIRTQAGVGRIAMRPGNRHRVPAILLGFKWKIRIILGLPWIVVRGRDQRLHFGRIKVVIC